MAIDYVTLTGIENKLGIKNEDIPKYIFEEIMANALDYIETLGDSTQECIT